MRYVIVHYCEKDGCGCLDRNGVIAYDGQDEQEAKKAFENPPTDYLALDESELHDQ